MLVEDDPAIRMVLRVALEDAGYEVLEADTGEKALVMAIDEAADVLLVDLRLPGIHGLDVVRTVRGASRVPIIILTAQTESHDIVAGLQAGADDYVTKPFDLRELLARIKAVLRRMTPAAPPPVEAAPVGRERLCFEHWELDVASRQLTGPEARPVALTAGEFDLLCVLARNAGRVLSRDFLLEQTRGREAAPFDRTIDVQIGRLRRKLEDDPEEPRLIKAVRGAGYMLVPVVITR